MKIIIGLGNPESKYIKTRHNIGHQVIDLLPSPPPQNLYLKSDQYMNNSGLFVSHIVKYYKIDMSNLYIIHDDLDLPLGDWRLQFGRGAAGHHGIESIIDHLGSRNFWRFRVGIGHPQDPTPVDHYVLQPFTPNEKTIITPTIDTVVQEIIKLS